MQKFTKTIYISHKYGGDKNNLKEVESIIKTQQKKHPNYVFISPLHMFSFLYDEVSYEDGLDRCLQQLTHCDEMWITGDKWYDSKGVRAEIEFAHENKISILFLKNTEDNPHKVEGSVEYIRGFNQAMKMMANQDEKTNETVKITEDNVRLTYEHWKSKNGDVTLTATLHATCPVCHKGVYLDRVHPTLYSNCEHCGIRLDWGDIIACN